MQWLYHSIVLCWISLSVTACASDTTLKAPCPNYGSGCVKQPINSWNNYN